MTNPSVEEAEVSATAEVRLSVARTILELERALVRHYDAKVQQLLVLIGINFAIVGLILAGALSATSVLKTYHRMIVGGYSLVNYTLMGISLLYIRIAAIPHPIATTGETKERCGVTFYRDIHLGFAQREYVDTLVGRTAYRRGGELKQFLEAVTEDFARDIFLQSGILTVKVANVRKAFNVVIYGSVFLILSTAALAVLVVLST